MRRLQYVPRSSRRCRSSTSLRGLERRRFLVTGLPNPIWPVLGVGTPTRGWSRPRHHQANLSRAEWWDRHLRVDVFRPRGRRISRSPESETYVIIGDSLAWKWLFATAAILEHPGVELASEDHRYSMKWTPTSSTIKVCTRVGNLQEEEGQKDKWPIRQAHEQTTVWIWFNWWTQHFQ
jgi:hypothetical protein